MIELTGKIKDFTLSPFEKKAILTVEINELDDIMAAYDELKLLGKLSIKLKKYTKKRTKNANAYMWVLCGKLGSRLGISKEEVYRQQIRNVGVFRPVELDSSISGTVFTAWRKLGIGWVVDELSEVNGRVSALLYYGSSTYNTAQMSRLIDSVVEECKLQGIQTLTPDELQEMKSLWKAEPI